MKKILPLIALSVLALVACKKGTVSGAVIDPFSGKAIELSTVWIKGTVYSSKKTSPDGLPDGKFKFEGIKPGEYTLEAGKDKHSRGRMDFTISKENLDVTQNVYIYSQDVSPGLYRPIEGSDAEKITNDWTMWQATCKETGFALRAKYEREEENPKTKKKEKKENALPGSKEVPAEITALYKISSSAPSPIEAVSYPVISASAKKHADCSRMGEKIAEKETLLVPDMNKGITLVSDYKSDNLYEIKGTLSGGEQFLALRQDGKLVGFYYLKVK